jgi:hypothetical protein
MVDGSKLFMDSGLVQADASNNFVIKINKDVLQIYLVKGFQELEFRLEETEIREDQDDDQEPKTGAANQNYFPPPIRILPLHARAPVNRSCNTKHTEVLMSGVVITQAYIKMILSSNPLNLVCCFCMI